MTHLDRPDSTLDITDAYSLEVNAKDIPALTAAASRILPTSTISIPYLPGQDNKVRLAAAQAVHQLGFEAMPHLAARRIASLTELELFIMRATAEAGVKRCLVIAGDPPNPMGPFPDSLSLIETGVFERSGIEVIGVGGHPEDHPAMSPSARWDVLDRKCRSIVMHGMTPLIITQFAFDADIVLTWLKALRERGLDHPVRIGVPGPAGIAVLMRYAALCGVSACASMWSKYGISMGKLLGTAGPDLFVDRLTAGLTEAHGKVNLHFFPFGGISQSARWIEQYRSRKHEAAR
ncbi:MAG: methylenetetrahydrofolate reductase [Corticimicrobacter sp.]|uniref:methylenetetrahydrofolate reductase n=1 Tax=Corticimicrobacter sp. TaxID=2678536 RepID=UPI0032D9B617